MKVKKKIDVEIEIKHKIMCDDDCLFFNRTIFEDTCILFNKEIRIKMRCQQCIEAFGMEQQEEYRNKCSGCFKDIDSDKPVCDECHKRLVQKHWGMGEE